MSQVVVISGHPNLGQSHTNTVILDHLQQRLSNVEVRRLDTLYPDLKIDVAAEQAALIDADIIVLQFPFYWYTVPGIMKQWMDEVFSYNFAFGSKGDKLKGKDFILSFTIGGPAESYDPLGYNHFTVEQMLYPLQQTAYLTGMVYRPPVYTNSMVYIPGVYNKLEDVQERARDHGDRLVAQINGLLESGENRVQKFIADWFARMDALPESAESFLPHLTDATVVSGPEGRFVGKDGFTAWYTSLLSIFKPGCEHQLEQIEIEATDAGYQADIRVRVLADTHADSPFAGQSVNMLVNELWQVSLDDHGTVLIHEYAIAPVQEQAA